ncbi:MAG: MerR family transcriptional regulator [Planctomycetes bacterium]|nr:MerR family transcriptional regulator [Planctomycetota bacterium]
MIESYTIGELARRAEVPTSTVRYYETAGLLRPAGRTASNYRFYGEESVQRLRFIRTAQAAGFTLQDITSLLELGDGTAAPCREVQVLIEARLNDVAKQLEDLQHVQEVFHASLHICRQAEAVLLGSAILGAVAAGDQPSVLDAMSAMSQPGQTITPATGQIAQFHDAKHTIFHRMYADLLAYRTLL